MRQICIKVFTRISMDLVGFKPHTALHQYLVQGACIAPPIWVEVANLSESIVSGISVICDAGLVEYRSIPFPQWRTVRRTAYDKFRAFIWKIARDVDMESVALSVVCVDLPFDSADETRRRKRHFGP